MALSYGAGDVKQSITSVLTACLKEYAMQSTTNLYIKTPSQMRLLFSTNMVALQVRVVEAVIMLVEHGDLAKPPLSSPDLRRPLIASP